MTVASRAVMMAVMTEARTTDVELKGHTSLTDAGHVQEDKHISHRVAVLTMGKVESAIPIHIIYDTALCVLKWIRKSYESHCLY